MRRDRAGFVFQSFNLVPSLTVELNVALPAGGGAARLLLGVRRPAAPARQLVVSAPTRLTTGDRVVVATSLGPRAFTVSGVLRSPAAPAFYAASAVAKRLAGGRIDAVALTVRPGYPAARLAARVRAAVRGAPVRVLTGNSRAAAQPGPDPVLIQQAVALLGTASGVAGFVSVFVVAAVRWAPAELWSAR